jgi:NADH dehydrogenase
LPPSYDRIDPEKDITINLIEAADRILPPLPKRLADESLKILEDLRVRVHNSARVEEVTASGVRLANGTFIPAELIVWPPAQHHPRLCKMPTAQQVPGAGGRPASRLPIF